MRKLILTAAIFGLVSADASAFGRLRGLVGRVVHPRQATASGGTCQSAPTVGPVRQAVGGTLQCVGSLAVDAGNTVRTVYRPSWDAPACRDGTCPTIPATSLPTR